VVGKQGEGEGGGMGVAGRFSS